MKIIKLVIILIFVSSLKASAFDFINDKELGLGKTIILSQSSASMLLTAPTGSLRRGDGLVEAGINRKFEMRDLDQGYMAGAYRIGSCTFTLGLTQFGYRDFYAERVAKAGLAYHYDSLSVGATISYMSINFGSTYEGISASTFGLGASYRTSKVFAAISMENLTSPRLDENSESINPRYSLYSEIIGLGSYSITGKLTLEKYEKPQLGIGQKMELSDISSIFWGLSNEPLIYGGGLELSYKQASIIYATSYHPTLGFSHTVSMGYHWANKNNQGSLSE